MDEPADTLRRSLVAHYRQRLADGVPADVARAYLTELTKLEAELAEIERRLALIASCPNPG